MLKHDGVHTPALAEDLYLLFMGNRVGTFFDLPFRSLFYGYESYFVFSFSHVPFVILIIQEDANSHDGGLARFLISSVFDYDGVIRHKSPPFILVENLVAI